MKNILTEENGLRYTVSEGEICVFLRDIFKKGDEP